ncbi:Gfo/Idh/MocA family oxidoreductase [Streptomyces sp. NBC_00631]|uniref:Gfo/Idh/MocA family protein n=1 Tax=Streptomyces sp. NBC_00631 TaxID=2975793 RepID=UPI0030DDF935
MSADCAPDPGPPRPRLAVLGTAHPHLGDHLRALAGRAEVVAVHEGRRPGGGSGPHPGLRGVPVVPDAAAALAGAQLALVCATTAEHSELLTAVARAGLPALVEKPLAVGLAETRELAERLTAAGTAVTTAMFLRQAPALRRARSLVADGRLGRLVACDAWFTHPGLLDGRFTGTGAAWMRDARWGARGAFADLGVHLVDLLRWLRPEAGLRVRGAVRHPPPAGLPDDAGGTALLEWGGVPAALHAGWMSRPGGVRLRLEGTLGTLQVAGGELTLATADGTLTEVHRPPAAGDAMTAFLTGAGEPAGPADAVACARVLEEIAEAAAPPG